MAATPDPKSLEFLLQGDLIGDFIPRIGREQWQSLFISGDRDPHSFGLWCALLDDEAAGDALKSDNWDLRIGSGGPGFCRSWSGGEQVTEYDRYSGDGGVRPLVLYREFAGAFPQYCELDEEFRLYHDLAHDTANGVLLDFDSSGREIEVARVGANEVTAKLKYLRQFQAGTGFHLAIYIDSVRYSELALDEVPEADRAWKRVDDRSIWGRHVSECRFVDGYHTFSRLLGKVILPPPPQDKAGIWPFDDDEDMGAEVSFVVGVDEEGSPVEYSCDPDGLANYFGANPNAPHYLTPVYFRREVLQKYFGEPHRYTVSDGLLSCLGLWSCRIDNDVESHVVVFLGDLGRDMPYEERLHWRQYNVPPEGGVSETNFRRSFLGQFAEPESPDLLFRSEYERLCRDWTARYGWSLFLELAEGDAHLLDTIRIPVTDSQSEMDEQVLHLTKLMIDSLNERELAARGGAIDSGTKGIGKLAAFFRETGFPAADSVVQFLKDLQLLRSTGSGHRKGSAYDKLIVRLGIDLSAKPRAVATLINDAMLALRSIRAHYLDDEGSDG